MLLILYGAIAEMGLKSREYFKRSGFQTVEKYNYAVAPILTTKYGTRNYVSEEVFMENTDSLFRYEVGGIKVGFNQQQISDAVCDKVNSLLTLSTKDISFLSEIKRVYADKVCLVYTYIDDDTLKGIITRLENITEDEARVRYETGCDVKQSYLQYQHIFDHVVMYGGEESVFNYQSLYRQFDKIVCGKTLVNDEKVQYAEVFISSTRKDSDIYSKIRYALSRKGISVFDDSQLTAGSDWTEVIANAIQNAKIVIPVITNNALNSTWVMHETMYALENAEKTGALIVPVFEGGVNLDKVPDIEYRIATLSCEIIENGNVEDASDRLADKIHKLLSAEVNLKSYSRQVENYLCLKMYDQAKHWQEAHLALCDDVYATSKGAFIDFEACLLSRIKLISILLDMKLYEDALEWSIDALNHLDDGDTYDVLVDQFAICCVYLGMDSDAVRELALKRLDEFGLFDSATSNDDRMQSYMRSHLDNILDRFANALHTVETNHKVVNEEVNKQVSDEDRIAEHGELAIALFEDIIKEPSKSISRLDLILGYERILNYCKHVGLKGDIADKCISRIAELSSIEGSSGLSESSIASEALKIYLGQALPKSGEYDVFLSYKSEDEILTKKIYDYLTQSGKEVFFAKETLSQLGESEYEEMIFEAIDRSRHMILIGSNPDYLKTSWVKDEWSTFNNEIREGRKNGNLILLLADDIAGDKGRLPGQLRQKEIVKMSEFRSRLLAYLR